MVYDDNIKLRGYLICLIGFYWVFFNGVSKLVILNLVDWKLEFIFMKYCLKNMVVLELKC